MIDLTDDIDSAPPAKRPRQALGDSENRSRNGDDIEEIRSQPRARSVARAIPEDDGFVVVAHNVQVRPDGQLTAFLTIHFVFSLLSCA